MKEEQNDNSINFEKILNDFFNSKTGSVLKTINPKFTNEIRELIDLINSREPRIMMVGRRGTGKSSLINALFGEKVARVGSVIAETPKAEWKTFSSNNKKIRVLDTRGAGEGGDVSGAEEKSPLKDIKKQIENEQPDIVIYVCKAKDVDANVEHDIKFLSDVISHLKKNYKQESLELLVVVNQVDELDPKRIVPPFDNEEKIKNIELATNHTKEMIEKYAKKHIDILGKTEKICTIPVCSYMEFDEITNKLKYDERWQIDLLFEHIVQRLPNSAKLQTLKLQNVKELQLSLAHKTVNTFAGITAGIGLQPIPAADMPIISSLQAFMIMIISAISGRTMELKTLRDILGSMGIQVGSGFAVREAARALVKLIPGYGSFVSGAIAGAATKIYGTIAIEYFINNKDANYIQNSFKEQMDRVKTKN